MVHGANYPPNTNGHHNTPSSRSKVPSHHDNFARKPPYKNYAIESPRDFPPLPPNSFRDKRDNKESMNNAASQPSQQLPPLPPTSQIQPSVTPDHQGEKPDIFSTFRRDTRNNKESMNNNASQPSKQPPSQPSQQLLPLSPTSQIQPSVTPDIFSSSQTQPSKNNGTKTSTNISDTSASSSSAAGFLICFGTMPPLVETTKPSSLTRPLPAATAKTSSSATLSTTSTSRPSQLPGDAANGDHEWKKCRTCHNHVKDCCRQSVLAALFHSGNIAAMGHKSTNVIHKGSQ
ncbi:PREDICTED: uncharacterized serine-rich protein C215.13-like isoform X2 [Populus euphratica]|uniref:Uncharacterized serine-rich protein C215.13-like isoform X2 n=1 Tax=Populus euphratica TaxID=75702 RepID=A0AAJ6VGQ0_POPEU|nr:PREDICTED: uncharacterized serine-rich protein C215.13-like isoform X2 [Populus euphratica]